MSVNISPNAVGIVMHFLKKHGDAIVGCATAGIGVCVASYPFLGSVPLFSAAIGLEGFFGGGMHTGVACLTLRLWAPSNKAINSAVQSLYLSFVVGCLAAPFVAKPFLSTKEEDSAIAMLYPAVGVSIVLLALAFVVFQLTGYAAHDENDGEDRKPRPAHHVASEVAIARNSDCAWSRRAFIAVILFEGFLYYTMQACCTYYASVFAVESLAMGKLEAADVVAAFVAGNFSNRVVGMVVVRYVKPSQMLAISYLCMTLGNAVLLPLVFGVESYAYEILSVGLFLVGFGNMAILPNIIIWLKHYVPTDSRMSGAVNFFTAAGIFVPPATVGQLLSAVPMVPVYYVLAVTLVGVVNFSVGVICARRLHPHEEPVRDLNVELCEKLTDNQNA